MNGLITVYRFKRFGLLMTMVAWLAGCVSTPEYRYYSLRALTGSTTEMAPSGKLSGISVGVMPVQAPEWLDKENVSYSDGGYRLYQADFDRWGEPLPQIMTRVMMRNMEQLSTDIDVSVGPWDRSQQPIYMVSVEVLDLSVKNNLMTLEVRWDVKEGQKAAMKSSYDKIEQPLSDSGYEAIAFGMSQAMSTLAGHLSKVLMNI